MRFHLLGLPHSKVNNDFGCCAFSTKVLKFTKILDMLGYESVVYAPEGSVCNNLVEVLSDEEFNRIYPYDHKKTQIDRDNKEGRNVFNKNTIKKINETKQEGDFILCSYGIADNIIVEGTGLPAIEFSVGYPTSNPKFHRVFESYARQHEQYGKEGTIHPNMYDTTIHAGFNVEQFEFIETPKDYFFWIGRPNEDKGWRLAVEVCKRLGKKLFLAGQEQDKINREIEDMGASDYAKHIGYVMPHERAEWMGNAIATFVPSRYVEPFGWTHVESLLCGTPVICTDFGAFTETIQHGKTGYRCMLFNDFIEAVNNIGNISRIYCREYAEDNFSLEVISKKYDTFFKRIYDLYNGGGRYSDNIPILNTTVY